MKDEADVDMIDVEADKKSGDGSENNIEEEEEKEKDPGSSADKDKHEDEIYIPQAEYSSVCNADFLPMICNDFIQEFLDKEHGACQLSRLEAINLTRNFCHWIAD